MSTITTLEAVACTSACSGGQGQCVWCVKKLVVGWYWAQGLPGRLNSLMVITSFA